MTVKRDFFILDIVFLTAIGVGGATVFGAVAGFAFKKAACKYMGVFLALAAGIMLSASFFSLILPSLELGGRFAAIITVVGIILGGVALDALDKLVKRLESKLFALDDGCGKRRKVLLFVAAIAIHNLPEGMAAGVGFGGGDTADALMIAGGIALQNIPEGMVIISPMLGAGITQRTAFLLAAMTGAVEVVGTFLGFFAVSALSSLLPFALAFAGGCMIYVIFDEMMPMASENSGERVANYAVISGFCAMILFDALLP